MNGRACWGWKATDVGTADGCLGRMAATPVGRLMSWLQACEHGRSMPTCQRRTGGLEGPNRHGNLVAGGAEGDVHIRHGEGGVRTGQPPSRHPTPGELKGQAGQGVKGCQTGYMVASMQAKVSKGVKMHGHRQLTGEVWGGHLEMIQRLGQSGSQGLRRWARE